MAHVNSNTVVGANELVPNNKIQGVGMGVLAIECYFCPSLIMSIGLSAGVDAEN